MLNERIRELRRAFGLSQAELAGAMNVSKQCVSNWENDNVQPSIDMLVKLADYFRVTTDYLLCRDEEGCPRSERTFRSGARAPQTARPRPPEQIVTFARHGRARNAQKLIARRRSRGNAAAHLPIVAGCPLPRRNCHTEIVAPNFLSLNFHALRKLWT